MKCALTPLEGKVISLEIHILAKTYINIFSLAGLVTLKDVFYIAKYMSTK